VGPLVSEDSIMMRGLHVLLLYCVVLCAGASHVAAPNPIRKVVVLLQDMQKELEIEMKKEQKLSEEFACICKTSDAELVKVGEKAEMAIKELTGKLEEEKAEKKQLDEDLKGHYVDKASAEGDLSKATNLREKEKEEAEGSIATARQGVASLSKAIPVLKKSTASFMQDGSLPAELKKVVSSAAFLGAFDRRTVLSFLDGQDGSSSVGQVLGIIETMRDQMQQNLDDAVKNEQAAVIAFDDLKSAKSQEVEIAHEAIETKEKRAGELSVSISQNTDALEDSGDELNDSRSFLGTLRKQCTEGAKGWEQRLLLRKEESAAISEAVKILNDDDARDTFQKATPSSFAEVGNPVGRVFLQQSVTKASRLERAASILSKVSALRKNTYFALLLNAIKSKARSAKKYGDSAPVDFSTVTKMIDEMIATLQREQADDDKKKEWCTAELSKAEKEERMKQEEIDSLASGIEEMSDEIGSIAEELATLQQEVMDLDRGVAEATGQRKKENAEYVETVSITKAAIQLIEKAKKKLAKVYGPKAKQSEVEASAASFLQNRLQKLLRDGDARRSSRVAPPPDLPEIPEMKNSGKGGGVIGLMVQITHEMEMDLSEATMQEKTAVQDYVSVMGESATARAQNVKTQTDKSASKAVLEEKIVESKENKKMASDELTNINGYLAELHSSCDFMVQNFKLRRDARSGELESMKSAKAVIRGMD